MLEIKAFDGMSATDVELELTATYNEPGGLDKIAALALQPIQEDVLYESRGRQLFAQYDLAPSEEAVFDGDVRVPGYALSVEGLPYQVEVRSGRTRIDTSPISSKALVKWNESNYRKFDMLDWTQARAKSSIMEQEDTKALTVLDVASQAYHSDVVCAGGKLTVAAIATAKSKVSSAIRTPAVKLVIPMEREADLIVLQSGTTSPIYAPTMQDELLRKGVLGQIAGLEVVSVPVKQDGSQIIGADYAYVVGPKELVGICAVRSEITPKTQVSVKDDGDLICFWEDIAFYCKYAKGVIRIKITA